MVGELVEIRRRNILEVITQLLREQRHIPENISEFQLDRFTGFRIKHSATIAEHLLHLVRNLPCLSGQTQRGIDRICSKIGV